MVSPEYGFSVRDELEGLPVRDPWYLGICVTCLRLFLLLLLLVVFYKGSNTFSKHGRRKGV